MKPVDQEFLHRPDIGQEGDCQRAVIASLLDLPIADVPHFAQDHVDGKGEYWASLFKFLAAHGYAYATLAPSAFKYSSGPIYHEISGPSPRMKGVYHAVVGCNGKITHDPHPDKSGLAGDPTEWEFSFLVRLGEVPA